MLGARAEPGRQGGRRSTLLWRLKVCSELRKGKREIVAVRFGFGFLMKGIYQHSCGQNIAAYFMFASGHSLLPPASCSLDRFLRSSLFFIFFSAPFRFGERIKFAQVLKLLGKDLHAKE